MYKNKEHNMLNMVDNMNIGNSLYNRNYDQIISLNEIEEN